MRSREHTRRLRARDERRDVTGGVLDRRASGAHAYSKSPDIASESTLSFPCLANLAQSLAARFARDCFSRRASSRREVKVDKANRCTSYDLFNHARPLSPEDAVAFRTRGS
jgi:hypothetical protein